MAATHTLTTIRTEVRERMGLSTNDTAVTDAILTNLVNAAQRKLSAAYDWPWLITVDTDFTALTAGTTTYAVTVPHDNWRKTLYIVREPTTNPTLLRVKQPQDIIRYVTFSGPPRMYAIRGTSLVFAPNPDAAYAIQHVYVKNPTELSLGTDVCEVEDWAIDLLIELAAVLAARRLRDNDMARQMEQEYQRTLSATIDEVRRTRQHPLPMHRTDVGW